MMMTMNEVEIFNRVIDVLGENNLRQGEDYIISRYNHGCFKIHICPRRYAVLDIHYFYERLPDIKIFKIKQYRDRITIVLKVTKR